MTFTKLVLLKNRVNRIVCVVAWTNSVLAEDHPDSFNTEKTSIKIFPKVIFSGKNDFHSEISWYTRDRLRENQGTAKEN